MENGDVTAKIARLIDIQKELDERKKLYDEYDAIVTDLQENGFQSVIFQGLHLWLVDNFPPGKNTAYKVASVKKWDIKMEPIEVYQKRLAKKAKAE